MGKITIPLPLPQSSMVCETKWLRRLFEVVWVSKIGNKLVRLKKKRSNFKEIEIK